jgi:hypothetical protein
MTIFWFVLLSAFGFLCLVISGYFYLRWWWQAAISFIITGAIAAVFFQATTPVTLGSDGQWFSMSPFRELFLFGSMLFGMLARVLSLAIEKHRSLDTSNAERVSTRLVIDRWEFVYPMLFAVPTFGALLTQLGDNPLSLPNFILAFQTGFFWQTVLKKTSA